MDTCTAGCIDTATEDKGSVSMTLNSTDLTGLIQALPHHANQPGSTGTGLKEMRPRQIKDELGDNMAKSETEMVTEHPWFLSTLGFITSSCLNGSSLVSRTSESTHLSQYLSKDNLLFSSE